MIAAIVRARDATIRLEIIEQTIGAIECEDFAAVEALEYIASLLTPTKT
jgi:hypothetical protein